MLYYTLMSKKTTPNYNIATMAPDEVTALRTVVKEFIDRIQNVDNEIEGLKEDRKSVIEEYSDKLDIKTLTMALKVVKIEAGVAHRDAYDLFMEALKDS